jgi:predicted phosphoadenosine phosphosulfate sulfurtransferase
MKAKIKKYIAQWEKNCYSKGIPEEVSIRLSQLNKVPNYKSICFTIMKNDTQLQTLGFNKNKSYVYHEYKRIELTERGVIKQLKLNI